jgi:aldehyde:ferredoxin oxidoreductase
MGITAKDDTLPDRFLKESKTNHPVKKVVNLKPMIAAYYKKKGYDSNGIPTPATLKSLDII